MYAHLGSPTNLCISDLKATRRQNQSHQGSREEHLNDGNIPFLRLMAFSEGVCCEYPKPFGRCFERSRYGLYCAWIVGFLTNSQVAVVLIESHKIHFHLDGWARIDGNKKRKEKEKGKKG